MLQYLKRLLALFRQERLEGARWHIAEDFNAYQRCVGAPPRWMCPNCLTSHAPLGRTSEGHRRYPACCGEPAGTRYDPLRHAVGKGLR